MESERNLTPEEREALLEILETRFESAPQRHRDILWASISERLEADKRKLWALNEMERTGGEPDVVILDTESADIVFVDCSAETPAQRRNLCYDRAALEARKKNKPENSAMEMADSMGIELLTEQQYRDLQMVGQFDLKTSSWVMTPDDVRERGGALFCDRRYGRVFLYHNGADSYYSSRGFRGILKL